MSSPPEAWLLVLTLVACTEHSPKELARADQPVALSEIGTVFELLPRLIEERSSVARYREIAGRASGTVFAPDLNEVGEPALASNRTRLRGTCGVTFVSPSLAVTSAHCVSSPDADLDALSVQLYRLSDALLDSPALGAPLEGSFPDFDTARLTEEDGYYVDRYPCELVVRCGEGWGSAIDCDSAVHALADVAVLRCDGRPGDKYGFLDVALEDEMDAAVYVASSHELYDIDVTLPADDDRMQHYVVYSERAENFHYFGEHPERGEANQLLPLFSPDFADGTAHRKISAGQSSVTTDVFGCHGTSGSGAMQALANGELQLLGPARYGNSELADYLCNHVPALDGAYRGPGGTGIGYAPLVHTQYALARPALGWVDDCSGSPQATFSLSTSFARECSRQYLLTMPENTAFEGNFEAPTARHSLDASSAPALVLGAGQGITLGQVELSAAVRYRVGLVLHVAAASAGAELTLAIGEEEAVTWPAEQTPQPVSLGAGFAATGSGIVSLSLSVLGAQRVELTALSFAPEAGVLDFDVEASRRRAVLHDLEQPAPAARPMRFAGDGVEGFEARLLANERMVVVGAGLESGGISNVTFRTSGEPLSCGLLDDDGAVILSADCSSGSVTLDDRSGTGHRAGLFLQTAPEGPGVSIDDVQLSFEAPLADEPDGCLDALSSAADVDWLLVDVAAAETCVPGPVPVSIPPPAPPCAVGVVSGELVRVNGVELELPIPTRDAMLLPPGQHTVVWSLRDDAGQVHVSEEQTVSVQFAPGAHCCAEGQVLVDGKAVVLSPESGTCLLGQSEAVVLAGGDEADWVLGSSAGDYLHTGAGDDVILGGDGDDVIVGARAATLVAYAGAGDDTIFANLANGATLSAGMGRDVVVGSDGPDSIDVGAGTELVAAGAGDDVLSLYDECELTAGMQLDGGDGHDTLQSPVGTDELAARGVLVESIEEVVIVELNYLAECFGQ